MKRFWKGNWWFIVALLALVTAIDAMISLTANTFAPERRWSRFATEHRCVEIDRRVGDGCTVLPAGDTFVTICDTDVVTYQCDFGKVTR
jgi:hypothetical protein